MKPSLLLFVLFVIFLSSTTSCTLTKRRYSGGYHVEWNKPSKRHAEVENIAPQESTISGQYNKSFDEENTQASSDSVIHMNENTSVSPISKEEKSDSFYETPQSTIKKRCSTLVGHAQEMQKFIPNGKIESQVRNGSDPKRAPNEFTGIVWLDWTLTGFLLAGCIWILIHYEKQWSFSAFWHPIAVAFTTNLWVTLIYIAMFIIVAVLIWKFMNWLFKLAFPGS